MMTVMIMIRNDWPSLSMELVHLGLLFIIYAYAEENDHANGFIADETLN
jgi:hypothetical protein